MFFPSLISRAGLLCRTNSPSNVISICNNLRGIHITPMLCAEPLKKRKKLDPAIVKMREQRRIKKIEKSMRILRRHGKKLKPIDEMEVSPALEREIGMRQRTVTIPENIASFREDLLRVWTNIRCKQSLENAAAIEAMVACQKSALEELRLTDSQLYNAAIEPDQKLLPYKFVTLTETPAIENYEVPDGKYVDVTKKWRP